MGIELEKHKGNTMSFRTYNLAITGFVLYGILINALLCIFLGPQCSGLIAAHPILFLIGYFVCAFIGIAMTNATDDPFIAFVGYNLVVCPVGILLSSVVSEAALNAIIVAAIGTALIVAAFLILALFFPTFFQSAERIAVGALFAVIIIELVMIPFFGGSCALIDYAVIAIMALFIGIDFVNANNSDRNVMNSIIYALSLYLDIINIFVRLLSRSSSSSSSK